MPALVLDEAVIRPQIHGHLSTADGTLRDELGRHAQAALAQDHASHGLAVVVGPLVAGERALPEPVVSLRVEEPVLVDAGILEAVVDVRGEHEVVAVADEPDDCLVRGSHLALVAVVPDVTAPPGPSLLGGGKGVEAARVHVADAVTCGEVAEESLEPLTVIGEATRGGEAGTGADQHGIAA